MCMQLSRMGNAIVSFLLIVFTVYTRLYIEFLIQILNIRNPGVDL